MLDCEASFAPPLYSRFNLNWTLYGADISDYFLDFVCVVFIIF